MKEKIKKLKKDKNAVILAHVYQKGEIQGIADYVGDSLDLCKKAVSTKADAIVFCGVQLWQKQQLFSIPIKKYFYLIKTQDADWQIWLLSNNLDG